MPVIGQVIASGRFLDALRLALFTILKSHAPQAAHKELPRSTSFPATGQVDDGRAWHSPGAGWPSWSTSHLTRWSWADMRAISGGDYAIDGRQPHGCLRTTPLPAGCHPVRNEVEISEDTFSATEKSL
jgi:hypothetical protein